MGLKVSTLLTAAGIVIAAQSFAEVVYQIEATTLTATTLFEQKVSEPTLVPVKPIAQQASVDPQQVTKQCLWSINVEVVAGKATYQPGKMICIGPKQEVLEVIPQGTIEGFAECVGGDCPSLNIGADVAVQMTLSEPLAFTLQPRNERQ